MEVVNEIMICVYISKWQIYDFYDYSNLAMCVYTVKTSLAVFFRSVEILKIISAECLNKERDNYLKDFYIVIFVKDRGLHTLRLYCALKQSGKAHVMMSWLLKASDRLTDNKW